MLWDYLVEYYRPGEPIIAADIEVGLSEVNQRQQFKILTDSGKLRRYENGIYYIPKMSMLGGELKLTPEEVIRSKYIERNRRIIGYYSGCTFANQIGITTQVPFVQEVITNELGSPVKRVNIEGRSFVLRKARTVVTEENCIVLQFLDLLKDIGQYAELQGEELGECLSRYILQNRITKESIDRYLSLFPERIYRSIYETGIANVFA